MPAVNTGETVGVAYSGGRDSTALLHATLAAAAGLGCKVVALHVHHGLVAAADDWLALCQQQVLRWQARGHAVSLEAERLVDGPAAGDSVEAWARKSRYRALQRMAKHHGIDTVLLAHHQRDQAETFLLQALRGGGLAGLSAMPRQVERDGITWLRPWLQRPRQDIEAYIRRHRLKFIDDDSNQDARFARNRLRLQVWPGLTEAFAQAEPSLANAARWAQQAQEALQELAAGDLAVVADQTRLSIEPWLTLSVARRSNALRAWLQQQLGHPAPASLVLRLLDQLPTTGEGRWPVPGGQLRSHRGVLLWVGTVQDPVAAPARDRSALQCSVAIQRAGRYRLAGWGGELRITRVREGGVPFEWLARLELQPRQGGEQFQSGIGRPPRSLKKQYQTAGVPEWQRGGPLVYNHGQLVFVPGLGIDARVIAPPAQPQADIEWLPAKIEG